MITGTSNNNFLSDVNGIPDENDKLYSDKSQRAKIMKNIELRKSME